MGTFHEWCTKEVTGGTIMVKNVHKPHGFGNKKQRKSADGTKIGRHIISDVDTRRQQMIWICWCDRRSGTHS